MIKYKIRDGYVRLFPSLSEIVRALYDTVQQHTTVGWPSPVTIVVPDVYGPGADVVVTLRPSRKRRT